jgi:uncharacterized delta-60 repeat protein
LDPDFDGPDATGTGVGTANGVFRIDFAGAFGRDELKSMMLLPGGKILLVGECDDDNFPAGRDTCVVRLKADGSFDATFTGTGPTPRPGRVRLQLSPGRDAGVSAVRQPDGKIVLLSECLNTAYNGPEFCLVRLNEADGSVDTSFATAAPLGDNVLRVSPAGGNRSVPGHLLIQSDGKLVAIGTCRNSATVRWQMCLARIHPDGTLDTTFSGPLGTGIGYFMVPEILPGEPSGAASAAWDATGRLVVFGWCGNTLRPCFVRLLAASGSFDAAFQGPGPGGVGVGTGGGRFPLADLQLDAGLYAPGAIPPSLPPVSVTLDASSRIVAAATCLNSPATPPRSEFCVMRLRADGSYDTDYTGVSGTAMGRERISVAGVSDNAFAVTIDSGGKLLIAGECRLDSGRFDFCVTRHLATPAASAPPRLACSLDVDGDGQTDGRDGLLIVRHLLGLRGTALTRDAVSPGSTRNADQISTHILANLHRWDIDLEGGPRTTSDGLALLRWLRGSTASASVTGVLSASAPRIGATAATYLEQGCP